MANAAFTAFEMSISRMVMFSSGKTLMELDRAAADAIHGGVSQKTIAAVANAFGKAARTLPDARAERVRSIMSGGLITRLKMEATGLSSSDPVAGSRMQS